MKLNEGLHHGDLNDLILSIISVDEYESKILDDAIVVGFKAIDKEPAEDLSRFIEHSGLEMLDSDVSPGPDEEGHYYVFVEFVRDKEFSTKLDKIIKMMDNITNVTDWQLQVYHTNELLPYSKENIDHNIRLTTDQVKENIAEFVKDCFADHIAISENLIYFDNKSYTLIDFGDENKLYKKYNLGFKPIKLDESSQQSVSKLQKIMGGCLIQKIDEYLIVSTDFSDKILILQD